MAHNLSTTQDLTRGTQDVDDGNIGRQDPRTSLEASTQGTSAKCAEMTPVVLEGTPHETQTEPQSSLPLTLRPPIDGEPCKCKQEVADNVVTAGRTNGTAKTANPPQIADVDRTATLGVDLATAACGVDEGDKMEREPQSRIQETNLLCEETRQRSGNATDDVSNTYGLPLEGEWTEYPSGETTNSKGVKLGRESGTDGGVEPTGDPNESDTLVTMSIKLESLGNGEIPRVYLGGMQICADDANRPGNGADASSYQADGSRSQADRSRAWMDTLNMSYSAETAVMGHGEGADTYLGVRDVTRAVHEMDGIGSHTDTPSVETNANKPADADAIIRIPRKKEKLPDIPVEAAWQHSDEPNGFGDATDVSSVSTDGPSVETETEMPANIRRNVRIPRIERNPRNSPSTREIVTPKPAYQWKRVSNGDSDMYIPWNAPVKALGRTLALREAESGDEVIAPRNAKEAAEGAGDGDGDQNGDGGDNGGDGDVDSTTSGGDANSTRVKAALLAAGSQHMRQDQQTRSKNLLVSSGPLTHHSECPYGLVRHLRRCGRIKFESRKVSQSHKAKTAYLEHVRGTQPLPNNPKHCLKVVGPRRQCDRIKIEAVKLEIERINDKTAREDEITHLGHARLTQPLQNAPKHCCGVHTTRRQRGRIKSIPRNINQVGEDGITYRGRAQLMQPPPNNSKRLYMVIGPRRQRDRIKFESINISRALEVENTYLRRVIVIWSIRRPKKIIKRLNELTFKYRMQGESWHDVEDHR